MTATPTPAIAFGVELGTHFDPDNLAADAVTAEALGFDYFSISDHLHTARASYDPWTALTWVAAATHRIAVLTNVLGLPYREPTVLAKMSETLDRLSGGRLVLGLGVGGHDAEFAAFGLPTRTPGQKVAALREAVQITRGLWTETTFSFRGEHFSTVDARIEPKPAHRIPIWIGAYGPRSLELTGQLADGWIPSFPRLDIERAVDMRAAVLAAASAADRPDGAVRCACNVVVRFDERATPTPQLLAGSDDAIAEQLVEIVRAGFTAPVISLEHPEHQHRLAEQVLPRVRAALS